MIAISTKVFDEKKSFENGKEQNQKINMNVIKKTQSIIILTVVCPHKQMSLQHFLSFFVINKTFIRSATNFSSIKDFREKQDRFRTCFKNLWNNPHLVFALQKKKSDSFVGSLYLRKLTTLWVADSCKKS